MLTEEPVNDGNKRRIRLVLATVALVGVIVTASVYSNRSTYGQNEMYLMTYDEKVPTAEDLNVVEYDFNLKMKQDFAHSGWVEALFCGFTPGGNHFWEEYDGGLKGLVEKAVVAHGEYIVRMVDGTETNSYVESKGWLGTQTVNGNLELSEELSHGIAGNLVGHNWKAGPGPNGAKKLAQIEYPVNAVCPSSPTGTFSDGAVYHACTSTDQGGLHVSKKNRWCEWKWRVGNRSPDKNTKKVEYFYLYYKQSNQCIIG